MRILGVLLATFFGAVFIWASGDLPAPGDPASPAASHDRVSVYYIENAYADTRTPNMVTAVLADYRGFDTFGEAVVVVAAAMSCLLILLRRRPGEGAHPYTKAGASGSAPGPDPEQRPADREGDGS